CTLFLPFQNPDNVGAMIRSAAAFGVARIVLTQEAASPFLPRATRAAGPALFRVPLLSGPPLASLAHVGFAQAGVPLVGLDARAPDIETARLPAAYGLVPGVEGPGLPPELSGKLVRFSIAMEPGVESLNAATATAVALYALRRPRPPFS